MPEETPAARVPDTDWREELLKNSSTEEAEPTHDSAQTGKSTETDQQSSQTEEIPTEKDYRPRSTKTQEPTP